MPSQTCKVKELSEPIWCASCIDKKKSYIRPANKLIPVRLSFYGSLPGGSMNLDIVGVCFECLENKNEFQQFMATDIDVNHPNLLRRHI